MKISQLVPFLCPFGVFTSHYAGSLLLLLVSAFLAHGVERCVLLTNGNLLVGDVQQLAHEVVVKTSTTEMRLPLEDVELVAQSSAKVYAYKAGKTSARPKAKASLIQWCLKHDLVTEAKEEFLQLQKSSPRYDGLTSLRQSLLRHLHSQHDASPRKTILPAGSPVHPDLQFALDRRDQVSKHSMRDFVRTVQPLLLNRCATAGCHGKAAKSSYQLIGSRAALSHGTTHRNLGATLQRIGGPTQQSLLWQSATQLHGGMERGLADDELAKLHQWLQTISSDLGRFSQSQAVQQVTAVFEADGSDPFDPAEFNSLHASIAGTSKPLEAEARLPRDETP